ncbi:MAG: ABC transporter ATP-binding protein [Pirellulales bacterium]
MSALSIDQVSHHYGERRALDALSLVIEQGEIFGLLGPNGSGKSTLFRLISTLTPLQKGDIRVEGESVRTHRDQVRSLIGIVFQSPSLDGKLSVEENLRCQSALYGLRGRAGESRIDEVLQAMGLSDRRQDRCEKLSGGLKRRVELAKGMLHHPRVFLMDEPSTGLDPSARIDFWHATVDLQKRHQSTVVLTTHLLEEAEKCDRIGILHQGKLVACGTPDGLRKETGDAVLMLTARNVESVASRLESKFTWKPQILHQQLRLAIPDAMRWVQPISEFLGDEIDSISVGRPSLEDVFIAKTGHTFWESDASHE